MNNIKKGDIVGRKSYNKDIYFKVKNIINTAEGKIAILTGIIERVEADSNIDDLEIIEKEELEKSLSRLERKLQNRFDNIKIDNKYKIGLITKDSRTKERIITGKILHLDGDKKYSEKSYYYYKKLGLNAIVKNVPEYRQPKIVYRLLQIYSPDILVITRT